MEERGILAFDTLADFPIVGDVRYYYIDESNQNEYYWNGSAYVVVPIGSGAVNWGSIGGTLSAQTDLQNALNDKISKNDYTNNFLLMGG
jgi:hypothetical protein